MADSETSMLAYWVEDKGIETALTEYYPNLLQKDLVLKAAYSQYIVAKAALAARVKQLTEEAEDDTD